MFNKILVTTDGSELALKGVRGAAQLADHASNPGI